MTDAGGIRAAILANGPTTLYRLFDGGGNLLYVGISNAAARRLLEHSNTREWWGEVYFVGFEKFASREAAAAAELAAIREERPRHNVVGQASATLSETVPRSVQSPYGSVMRNAWSRATLAHRLHLGSLGATTILVGGTVALLMTYSVALYSTMGAQHWGDWGYLAAGVAPGGALTVAALGRLTWAARGLASRGLTGAEPPQTS